MFYKIITNFKKSISIKTQFYTISFIMIIVIIILCLFVNTTSKNMLLNNTKDQVERTFDKFQNEMEFLYYQLNTICENFQYEIAYTKFLSSGSYNEINSYIITEVTEKTTAMKILNPSIVDIAFVNDLINRSNVYSVSDLKQMYRELAGIHGTSSLGLRRSTIPAYRDTPFFVFGYNIYHDYKKIGSVILSVDIAKSTVHLPYEKDALASFILVDNSLNISPFNCTEEAAEEILDQCVNIIGAYDKNNPVYQDVTAKKYAVGLSYLPDVKSFIISAVNTNQVGDMLHEVRFLIWLTVLLTILFHFILSFILFRNLVTPLNRFNREIIHIREKKQRDLKEPLVLFGCAEIVNITVEFTNMLSTIHRLNENIFQTSANLYEVEIQKQKAEISYLRSQINPHFLYNTLEMVRSLALENNVPEIATISIAMGKIFRYGAKGSAFVPLSEELEITKAYLAIWQSRFQYKFDVILNFDQDTLNVPVIRMLLQPLVENAVTYGLEAKTDEGTLFIGGRINDGILQITVRDDGAGIPAELLEILKNNLASNIFDTSRHVGLVNTDARIKLQYGKQYGLSVDSREGDGTVITIRLPVTYTINGGPDNPKEDSYV